MAYAKFAPLPFREASPSHEVPLPAQRGRPLGSVTTLRGAARKQWASAQPGAAPKKPGRPPKGKRPQVPAKKLSGELKRTAKVAFEVESKKSAK